MSIRRYIFIPMIAVIIVCTITAFVLSWGHFTAGMYDVAHSKVDVAAVSVMRKIETFEQPALLASIITAENPNLVSAVLSNDHDTVLAAAYTTMNLAQTDFCTILDSEGTVLARTHEPDMYGDQLTYQYGITQALSGIQQTTVEPGSAILLSVRSAAPIYDDDMNVIGVVSLGYRFDDPEFVISLKETTGCEIVIYRGNECINSTMTDEAGECLLSRSPAVMNVVSGTLAGEEFYGQIEIYGRDMLARFMPLEGPEGEVVGVVGVGEFWRENNEQMDAFRFTVIIIILFSLLVIFAVSLLVTQFIDRRINNLVNTVNETGKNRDAIMEALHTMIVITDMDTDDILYMNEQMKGTLGLGDGVIGDKCWKYLNKGLDDRCVYCPKNNPDLYTGKSLTWEFHNPNVNRDYRITSRILDWPDGRKVMIEQADDITDMKEADELKYELYVAENASKAKSTFLANMSHEIRTPLNAILGIVENHLRGKDLSTELEEDLEIVYESGSLLLNIINDILDLSKIESGKMEIIPTKYDMPSLVNDTVQLVHLRYDSHPVDFVLDVDAGTPLNLFGDELRIKQILGNIMSNAFKYTDKGEVKLSVRAEASDSGRLKVESGKSGDGRSDDKQQLSTQYTQQDEVTLVFKVTDTGLGMTEDQLSKLFDEYARFHMDANRTTVGAGLGMSITKHLVDLMGGEISVESKAGSGSAFTVCIPQKRLDELVCGDDLVEKLRTFKFQSTSMEKKGGIIRAYMPYGSVLIVDDVDSNTHVARGMLMPYGLKIDSVNSGFSAIERIINGNKYDIIFMDHMMPQMDGIETVKILREQHGYEETIVALTANALVGQAEMFLENGFDGFISKPIDSRELDIALHKFILSKQPPEVLEAAKRELEEALSASAEESFSAKPAGGLEALLSAPENTLDYELSLIAISDIKQVINKVEDMNIESGELSDKQLNTYKITMHGIKSALYNIGERSLADFALKLDSAALEMDLDTVYSETPKFIDELKALLSRLK